MITVLRKTHMDTGLNNYLAGYTLYTLLMLDIYFFHHRFDVKLAEANHIEFIIDILM